MVSAIGETPRRAGNGTSELLRAACRKIVFAFASGQ